MEFDECVEWVEDQGYRVTNEDSAYEILNSMEFFISQLNQFFTVTTTHYLLDNYTLEQIEERFRCFHFGDHFLVINYGHEIIIIRKELVTDNGKKLRERCYWCLDKEDLLFVFRHRW